MLNSKISTIGIWVLLVPTLGLGSIWPESFGVFRRGPVKPAVVADEPLWSEYGFHEGEEARYQSDGQEFSATAYRFQDSTGAMAAFESQRPANAKPSNFAKLAVETPSGLLLAHGNYLFDFQGRRPQEAEMGALLQKLPRLEQSSLPVSYLPGQARVPNSEQYILGPVGLGKFEPRIPPSVAAFHMGSEAEVGTYGSSKGELKLAVFSYPTPQIARERVAEFQRIGGATAKRSGPLVAVVVSPPDPDEAEKLLALVRYQASITWSEHVPTRRDNIGDLIINVFILIGILLGFAAVAGLAFGGFRAFWYGRGGREEPEHMTVLHLRDR